MKTTTTTTPAEDQVQLLFSEEAQEELQSMGVLTCYYTGEGLREPQDDYIQWIRDQDGDPDNLQQILDDEDYEDEKEKAEIENQIKELEEAEEAISDHWLKEEQKSKEIENKYTKIIKEAGGTYRAIEIAQELKILKYTGNYYEDYQEYKSNYEDGRNSYYGWSMNGGGGKKEFNSMYGSGDSMSFEEWFRKETGYIIL